MKRYFNYGDVDKIAQAVGVSPGFIGKLFRRERRATPALAEALAAECEKMGYDIKREDWANPQWSDHEAFRGEKI